VADVAAYLLALTTAWRRPIPPRHPAIDHELLNLDALMEIDAGRQRPRVSGAIEALLRRPGAATPRCF